MPELPEVERAAALIRSVAKGKVIHHVHTSEDELVYSRLSHLEFAKEIAGRTVIDAARYGKSSSLTAPSRNNPIGKCFYIQLDGKGRMPVLHFGMTGILKVRGKSTLQYKSSLGSSSDVWPPRFVKFILFIQENNSSFTELAFCDARRLGRIRMASSPLNEPPISDLGFDPILSMPSLGDFRHTVSRRTCPIKALLLDQSFSAGVGNYLAGPHDFVYILIALAQLYEILYQAQVHPEQRCNTLDTRQILALHRQITDVCRIAVEANADDSKYPAHWLFHHRWDKGKKPSGEPATVKWITVGGRTSAYVGEIQKPFLKRKNYDEPPKVLSPVTLVGVLE
ncbi:Formamidopyrimidine-DNA glycosylase N-terminal domain-containing protein [Boletus coccyginus]|nr:Formamidopyrimidine-DNA glycosylase N-terminal domain-containing protein [Boletus coccyginus]